MRNELLVAIAAILLTGAALKMAADGQFGEDIQKGAKFITAGYGSV